VQIGSLTDADWRALQEKAAILCAGYTEPKQRDADGEVPALRGPDIPESLRYLRPQRAWIRPNSVMIELWHTPAGDDTIWVDRGVDGTWTITIHEGSWRNKERIVWSSKKEPNQALEPTALLGRGSS
jgi:hypothetical protein